VARVVTAVFRRVERTLADREPDAAQRRFIENAPVLTAVVEASARGVIATDPRRGRGTIRIRGAPADIDAFVMGKLCAQIEGYNLQAATRIRANDREGLKRMARYLARPRSPPPTGCRSLTTAASSCGSSERLERWHHGIRIHAARDHRAARGDRASPDGAPDSLLWGAGVRLRGQVGDRSHPGCRLLAGSARATTDRDRRKRVGRVPWAWLIWRVFLNDVLECGRCGGRMEIIAAVTSTEAVTRILENLGLPSAPPAFHSARPPPQTELSFAGDGFGADPPAANGFEPDPAHDDFGA
jgi:hypothetical protein